MMGFLIVKIKYFFKKKIKSVETINLNFKIIVLVYRTVHHFSIETRETSWYERNRVVLSGTKSETERISEYFVSLPKRYVPINTTGIGTSA